MRLSEVPTALVVEDDEDVRHLWRIVLEHANMRVLCASRQREALETARTETIDVILLDVHLAGSSGWDVLDALTADPVLARVPIIMLSGETEAPPPERLGRATYLTKPIRLAELLAVVEAALDAPASR